MFVRYELITIIQLHMIISQDTTIIITGASSGIGYSLALQCAERKAKVVLLARRFERLLELSDKVHEMGGRALPIRCDITKSKEVEASIDAVIEHFGTIDILINNAGRGYTASVEHTTDEDIRSMFEVNAFSLWYATRKVLPIMRTRNKGVIVTVSSVAGRMGFPFNSAYVAAKHAAIGFHAGLTAELAGTNIRSLVICPDGVETEWAQVTENAPIGDLFSKGIRYSREIAREKNIPLSPLARMKSPDDIARIIIEGIENDTSPLDIFTHEGSYERSVLAVQDRNEQVNTMYPLYAGMQKAYSEKK